MVVSASTEPIAQAYGVGAVASIVSAGGGTSGDYIGSNNSDSNWWKENTYGKIIGTWRFHEGSGRLEWKLP